MELFLELNPVVQAFIANLFTRWVTAAGAALLFLKKKVSKKALESMIGFAAGVKIAASIL